LLAETTTSTSTPPETAPPADEFDDPASTPAPAGATAGGDDTAAPSGGRIPVPPEAQRIINSVKRTRASNSTRLLDQVRQLEQLGVSTEEAIRVGFGRFPIAGASSYVHDWLYPRYGPGFRFHLGTDVFAAYGTPVRAPVDGTAHSATGALGGLYVKVVMADRTYFYLAHHSALAEGFVEGMPVKTGDIVGFVGDSGNARGGTPHLHIEIHPKGGAPIDPKPVLDRFLAEAEMRLPEVIAHYQQQAGAAIAQPSASAFDAAVRRPTLALGLLNPRVAAASAPLPTELLYATAGNPTAGVLHLVDAEATAMASSIDWGRRQDLELTRLDLLIRLEASLRTLLEPVAPDRSGALAAQIVRG
jgi:murein DD-endopeptidase MepM/ murein hydrolase activator NlpD